MEELAKLAARDDAMASRGRGRGAPRGRGDAMGRKVEQRTTASGTFGVAPAEMGMFSIYLVDNSRLMI